MLILVRELLECAALGLGDKVRREDTGKHEERKDLQTIRTKTESVIKPLTSGKNYVHVTDELARAANIL
jgi:hypothetical protein